nr:hypothetical protein Iba_chr02eCG2020 [Ipomoea batatas]GMC66099.1 hypothetical protein Iba_chr02eCG2460 [Ipomoea batatas]
MRTPTLVPPHLPDMYLEALQPETGEMATMEGKRQEVDLTFPATIAGGEPISDEAIITRAPVPFASVLRVLKAVVVQKPRAFIHIEETTGVAIRRITPPPSKAILHPPRRHRAIRQRLAAILQQKTVPRRHLKVPAVKRRELFNLTAAIHRNANQNTLSRQILHLKSPNFRIPVAATIQANSRTF